MKINLGEKKVWISSDFHYNHKSIVRGVTNWSSDEECRDFNTLEEHDNTLVDNINRVVGEDDILFCLGDFAFGAIKNGGEIKAREFREKINCKEVYLILGNHDSALTSNKNNIQDIFQGVFSYLEVTFKQPYTGKEQGIKATKQKVIMMHYPIRSWNHMRSGAYMLHGHCHGNLPDLVVKNNIQRTMDVGIDCHPEFRPFSWEEIKNIMDTREVFTEDHH